MLANRPGEHDWPPGVGQLARTQSALRLSETTAARPGSLSPVQVVTIARSQVPPETVVTVDAGAHMLAVMPLWEVTEPRRLLISSGLATMGFALPAAIAAGLSAPDRLVVAFTGDGGLGMTLAEIETAARLRLRIAVVVFNDGALSLIKIKQRPAGQGGPEAVDFGPVSYARAAQALGAAAVTVSTEPDLAAALSAASGRDGPTVIDVRVDPAAYPAIMDLSRGEAGRRPVPGLQQTVRSIQCRLPRRNSRIWRSSRSPRSAAPDSLPVLPEMPAVSVVGGSIGGLTAALVLRDGVLRPVSLPPGAATERALSALRQAAVRLLAPPLAEVVPRVTSARRRGGRPTRPFAASAVSR